MDSKKIQEIVKYGRKDEAIAACLDKKTDPGALANLLIFSVQKNWSDAAEKACDGLISNTNAQTPQWFIDIAGRYCLMQNNGKIFKKIEHLVDKQSLCDILLADMDQNSLQFDQNKHIKKILSQMELLLENTEDEAFAQMTKKSDIFSRSPVIKSRMDQIAIRDQIDIGLGETAGADKKPKKI